MAKTADFFRKHQKLVIGAMLLAMVGFVLADFFNPGGGGGGGPNPVVVETNRFSLSENELRDALADRELVHRYVGLAVQEILVQRELRRAQAQFPQITLQQLRSFIPYDRIAEQANMYVLNRFGPNSERSVVDALVLADEARRMGIEASEEQVKSFITKSVQIFPPPDQLSNDTLNTIVSTIGGQGNRIGQKQIIDAFRTEMMATTMRSVFISEPAVATTPVDRWNAYLRKRCRATAEVLPIRTADVIAKSGDKFNPTEPQLVSFFEKYRYNEPVLGSPDPGFKTPQKAKFQYFAAVESKFSEPDKITSEQIAEHYEKNKSRYMYTPEDFAATEIVTTEKKPETATEPKPETPVTEPVKSEPPKAEPAKTDAPKENGASAKPQVGGAPEVKGKPETNGALKTKEKKPVQVSPDCGDGDVSDESSCGDAAPEDEQPAPTATTTTTTPAATATATAAPTATASGTAAAPVPSATATGTAAAVAAPAVLPPPPLPTENWLLPDDIRSGRTPQYDPLWRVEDKIRNELARKAAADQVTKIFDELKEKLREESFKRELKSDKPIYTDEEWKALVAKHPSIVAGSTPLVTPAEAALSAENPGLFRATADGENIATVGFSDASIYIAREAVEIPEMTEEDSNSVTRYLYWKTQHQPAKVHELADIRDEVVFAYKTQAARSATREEAQKLAKESRQSPRPLGEQFPERGVVLTNAFKWYEVDLAGEFGQQERPTRISKVDGVEDPGPEFMQTVFEMQPGDVGVAMNHPETICYVVRLTNITPSPDKLYDTFMVDNFQTYQQFSQADAIGDGQAAMQTLLAEANIKWLRDPVDRRER